MSVCPRREGIDASVTGAPPGRTHATRRQGSGQRIQPLEDAPRPLLADAQVGVLRHLRVVAGGDRHHLAEAGAGQVARRSISSVVSGVTAWKPSATARAHPRDHACRS